MGVSVKVRQSPYLGLTEGQILARPEVRKLLREHGVEGGKWFVGKTLFLPTPSSQGDGYVISRCHILTFRDGKVIKHEAINRQTGHFSFVLREN